MKKKYYFLLSLAICLLSESAIILHAAPQAIAQITPDKTLPVNAIVSNEGKIFRIKGGTSSGSNLFFSFKQFSVPTNTKVFFDNSLAIQNIFSRVTGGSISKVDGSIQTNGTANLFLLNPKGILFGPNASLNIGGSFIASTASSIRFADGSLFDANCCQTQPLLTISVPIGLEFGSSPSPIINQSRITTLSPEGIPIPIGLQVPSGQTLALVGGEIRLNGGHLTAFGGHIELGSVAQGQVSLTSTNSGYAFEYEGVKNFGDVRLSNLAQVDASGLGGGEIQVQGRNVILTGGSKIRSNTLGSKPGRNITINASNSVQVLGTTSSPDLFEPIEAIFGILVPQRSAINTITLGAGDAGDVAINARQLILRDGGQINASTFSTFGNGGNSTVNAPAASGNGGDLTVNASESVEVSGVAPVGPGGQSPFGPGRLLVEINGASALGTVTGTTGRAGNLSINTSRLLVRNGGIITANPFAEGQGGNLTINATDSVEVRGKSPNGSFDSIIATTAFGAGNAGDITVNTDKLIARDGADIAVSSLRGSGDAGTLEIMANSIRLDNQADITAATASGEGGNINLQVPNILQLSNNSSISAKAGGTGKGGNIDIDAGTVVARPNENSDIIANASEGQGGNINITSQGVFGLEERTATPGNRTNDIDASSQLGLNGTINIQTLTTEPSRGLVAPPAVPADPSRLIAQGCSVREGATARKPSEFVVTGRGGVPASPYEALSSDAVLTNWAEPESRSSQVKHGSQAAESTLDDSVTAKSSSEVVEAQGWLKTPDGQVMLVAQAPTATPHSSGLAQPSCPGS